MYVKMYQLTCPACGAVVEVEKGRKTVYCTYCGNKIYVDDGATKIEITKNITYHKIYTDEARINSIQAQERMQYKEYEERRNQWERDERSKRNELKLTLVILFVALGAFVGLYLSAGIYFRSEEQASILQEKELQSIVDAILLDIENGHFEEAYIKAETLYYTEGWSSDIEKKWKATRKEVIKQIEAAEKKAKKENNGSKWNPFD